MPIASQRIPFPVKGEHRGGGYHQQPELTTPDSLNVLPFDPRGQRLRGGQRAGTGKLNADAFADGQKVMAVHQTTRPGEPAKPGTVLHHDVFSLNDNSALEVYGGEGTGAVWHTRENNNLYAYTTNTGTNPSTRMLLKGKVSFSGWTAHGMSAWLNKINTPADQFEVSARVWLPNAGEQQNEMWLFGKAPNVLGASDDGVKLIFTRSRMWIGQNTGGGSYTDLASHTFATPLLADTDYTFTLRFSGSIVTAYLNGAEFLSGTYNSAALAANGKCGFGYNGYIVLTGAPSYNSGNAGVREFKVNGLPTGAVPRQSRIIAACGGTVWYGPDPAHVGLADGIDGVGILNPNAVPAICDVDGYAYLFDGLGAFKMDLNTADVSPFAATQGQLPEGIRIACIWRARLVASDGLNIYLSRAGDAGDWDYGRDDAMSAVALNASSSAGRIGQPVVFLYPFRDDSLVIGCDHSLFLLKGDPADGGSLLTISEAIGGIGKDAVCQDPAGNLYFLGTGGFYRLDPAAGSVPVNLSAGRQDPFFSDLDRNERFYSLAWDRDKGGCWIFVTNKDGSPSIHFWYDAKTDSFWRQQFPLSHGPNHAIVYDGDEAGQRLLIMACNDGYLRSCGPLSPTDDGEAITSYVWIGPFRPGDDRLTATLTALDFYTGEVPPEIAPINWRLRYLVQAADDSHSAINSPRRKVGGTFRRPGKQLARIARLAGGAFAVKLFNDEIHCAWTLESLTATFAQGGRAR